MHSSNRRSTFFWVIEVCIFYNKTHCSTSFNILSDLVDGEELKTVMEGDVLTLQTRDTESLSKVTWLFEGGDQTVRITQMYQGFAPFYVERLTGRVKMNPKTGALTIWNISSSDSGLYQVSLHSGSVSEKRFRVDVYSKF